MQKHSELYSQIVNTSLKIKIVYFTLWNDNNKEEESFQKQSNFGDMSYDHGLTYEQRLVIVHWLNKSSFIEKDFETRQYFILAVTLVTVFDIYNNLKLYFYTSENTKYVTNTLIPVRFCYLENLQNGRYRWLPRYDVSYTDLCNKSVYMC